MTFKLRPGLYGGLYIGTVAWGGLGGESNFFLLFLSAVPIAGDLEPEPRAALMSPSFSPSNECAWFKNFTGLK